MNRLSDRPSDSLILFLNEWMDDLGWCGGSLLPHSKKVLSLSPGWAVWNLHALPIFSGCSGSPTVQSVWVSVLSCVRKGIRCKKLCG